jgi:hypothetical protein
LPKGKISPNLFTLDLIGWSAVIVLTSCGRARKSGAAKGKGFSRVKLFIFGNFVCKKMANNWRR